MNPSIRQEFVSIMEANLPKLSETNRQIKYLTVLLPIGREGQGVH